MTPAWLRAPAIAGILLCAPALAIAQEAAATPSIVTGYLDADHWAVQAAWRANGMGLAPSLMPAQRLLSLATVQAALREAERSAEQGSPRVRELARDWYTRFAEEFPGVVRYGENPRAARLASASLELGAVRHTGRAAPGRNVALNQTGSETLEDRAGAIASAEATLSIGSFAAVQLAPRLDSDGLDLAVADLTLALGPWTASVGRQAIGYGSGRADGVVLSGTEPFDRVEIATRRPLRLPGRLSVVGPFAFHTFFTDLPADRHSEAYYFWGARGSWRPHPRFDLSVQRAAMFGGREEPVTPRKVLLMLIGRVVSGGFENQIVSAAARFRLPTESFIPLTVYGESGAEDAAGAWKDAPGYVIGIETPAFPSLPELSMGVELAAFSPSCCGNPPWYRHSAFTGGWAWGDATLGHPIGGHGSELLAHASADLLDARLRLSTRAFRRTRRQENLFVPGRAGQSTGFSAHAAWRILPGSEVYLSGDREEGSGWTESVVQLGGRLFPAN